MRGLHSRLASDSADVCALGRLVIRVCAMTFAVVARLVYITPLPRMSAGQGRDGLWRSPIWVRRMGCRRWIGP